MAKVSVVPFDRANVGVRGFMVQAMDGNPTGNIVSSTGFRLGTNGLLVQDVNGLRFYRGAVRDDNGLWTEWSQTLPLNQGPYVGGVGAVEGSIGSGAAIDNNIQSPGVEFPDLSTGSGKVSVFRTLVSSGFGDEVRTAAWSRMRAVFHCVFTDLDEWQTGMLHRFWRAINGPGAPFFFDYADPSINPNPRLPPRLTVPSVRYIVRFRDPSIVSKLFAVDRSQMEFVLIELMDEPEGGDV
jgi:hypothetical protein